MRHSTADGCLYKSPITTCKCDKSPGSDGLSTNFYKFFWPDVCDLLIDSNNYAFNFNELSQEVAIKNLIPQKDKDLRYPKNWRPVSLLNTDFKILTKALAGKLQNVISILVNEDQVGYITGRYIGETIRTIDDIMMLTEKEQIPGFITLVDFEKAFDSIEWPFLFKVSILVTILCLRSKHYIQIFSHALARMVIILESINISRSVRQGCPISAVLFMLVAEILPICIRQNNEIQGITLCNTTFKIAQLPDYITLFLPKLESVSNSIALFKFFSDFSGLRLNLDKKEVTPIGKNVGKNIILPQDLKKLRYKTSAFKTLGIWF